MSDEEAARPGTRGPEEVIAPPSIDGSGEVGAPTLAMRSYLSSHHLWIARHLARLASARELASRGFDVQHRGYVVGAVIESVAFLEAMINELFQDAADDHGAYIESVPPAARASWALVWSATNDGFIELMKKYEIGLAAAAAPALERGAEPFQSAALLIEIRNLLVHFRPETACVADVEKIQRRASGKFPTLERMATNPWWPDQCLGAGCAAWSVKTARSLTDEFCARLGIRPNYQLVEWPEP